MYSHINIYFDEIMLKLKSIIHFSFKICHRHHSMPINADTYHHFNAFIILHYIDIL